MSVNYNIITRRSCKQHQTTDAKKLLQIHGIMRHIKIKLHRTECKKTENEIKIVDWYSCPHSTCTFKSESLTKVDKHASHNHKQKSFECYSCGKYLASEKSLQLHHMIMHSKPKQKKFRCNYANCSFSSNEKRILTQHVMVHEGQKPHKCSFCGWRGRQKVHLKQHIETWHEDQILIIGSTETKIKKRERNFKCPTCDYSCYTAVMLKVHNRVHTGHKPFKCPICNYSAKQSTHLTNHLKIHSGLKPHSCQLCNYKCIALSTLNAHMRTHTREKPYACVHCPHMFSQSSALTAHIMHIHTQEKPYACSQCDYKSRSNSGLTSHVKNKHEVRMRNIPCALCPKLFFSSFHLRSHIRTHTQEKPYACQFCQRKICQLSARKLHENICKLRPDGLQIKPHKCQFCSYAFGTNWDKSNHERCCPRRPDGLVIKPFRCKFCKRAFTTSSQQCTHEKRCKLRVCT